MSLVRGHVQALAEVSGLLRAQRKLIMEMARRDILDRYSGQVLGASWALIHPLLLIGVYVFVFVVVFKIKVGGVGGGPEDYPAYLLAGLIPWLFCQEVIGKASTAISSNVVLVKQAVFPLETLPAKGLVASALAEAVSIGFLLVYLLVRNGALPGTLVLLPVALLLQTMLMLGISYALAAVGIYLRDTKDVMQMFTVVGVYIIPVVYLPSQVPELFRPLLYANPFSYMVWCFQDVFYFGAVQSPGVWLVYALASILSLSFGYRIFRRTRLHVGNIL